MRCSPPDFSIALARLRAFANGQVAREVSPIALDGAGALPAPDLPPRASAPRGLTARQERFAAAYIVEPNATRAAIKAGYAPGSAHNQASRMMRNDEVLRKIAELREAQQLVYAVSRETLLDKLEAVYDFAMEAKRFTPAVRAVMAQARLAGLLESRNPQGDMTQARVFEMTGVFPRRWHGPAHDPQRPRAAWEDGAA